MFLVSGTESYLPCRGNFTDFYSNVHLCWITSLVWLHGSAVSVLAVRAALSGAKFSHGITGSKQDMLLLETGFWPFILTASRANDLKTKRHESSDVYSGFQTAQSVKADRESGVWTRKHHSWTWGRTGHCCIAMAPSVLWSQYQQQVQLEFSAIISLCRCPPR